MGNRLGAPDQCWPGLDVVEREYSFVSLDGNRRRNIGDGWTAYYRQPMGRRD